MPPTIPVFLSVGEPHVEMQEKYIQELEKLLLTYGIECKTLGRTEWSLESPLIPVQRLMKEVYGAAILAVERFHSIKGSIQREKSKRNNC